MTFMVHWWSNIPQILQKTALSSAFGREIRKYSFKAEARAIVNLIEENPDAKVVLDLLVNTLFVICK